MPKYHAIIVKEMQCNNLLLRQGYLQLLLCFNIQVT